MINLSRECSPRKPSSEIEKALDELEVIARLIDEQTLWGYAERDESPQTPRERHIELLKIAAPIFAGMQSARLEQALAVHREEIHAVIVGQIKSGTHNTAAVALRLREIQQASRTHTANGPAPAPRPDAPSTDQHQAPRAKESSPGMDADLRRFSR